MKNANSKFPEIRIVVGMTTALLLASLPPIARADRGEGSIRASNRSAPATSGGARSESSHSPAPARAQEPSGRPEAPHEPQQSRPQQPDEPHNTRDERPQPVAEPRPSGRDTEHPDARRSPEAPAARSPARPQRNWDDNDDDTKSWGGFAHGSAAPARRGQRVHDLPGSHRVIVINHQNYDYDDDGTYYLPQSDGEYLVVQPPDGASIPGLPDGAVTIQVGDTTYYYLDGVFYAAENGGFIVVDPPSGIIVPTLPAEANQAVINGAPGYQFNGFTYRPSIQDGVTVYTVSR